MDSRNIQNIYERLKIIQVTYSNLNIEAILDAKRFLEILEKNILLSEISAPTEICVEGTDLLCFDWYKTKNKKLDIFSLYFIGDGGFVYEAFLDTLGTETKKTCEIKEDLDEVFLIHIKHFS